MKKREGFTLVELLVALAITSILVVLLTSVVSAALSTWRQGRNRLDTFSNARQLIGRLQDEISAATAAKDRIEFVENNSSLSTTNPTSENIFFVAPYPNSGSGDLCVIMYRHNTITHRLERRFKDSAGAWNVAPADRYKVGKYPDTTPSEWRVVADGVIEFEIRSYSQRDLDNNVAIPAASWNSAAPGNADMEGKTPRRVVLRLKVVDDRTLVRMAGMTAGSPAYNDVMTKAGREFFADFSLPSR